MIGLVQRVSSASVSVGGREIAAISRGLLVLVGVERGDDPAQADRLAERLLAYRLFADESGRMNRSIVDEAGQILLVPQFTLVADTSGGNRPGFDRAAPPAAAKALFEHLLAAVSQRLPHVKAGIFGADMDVSLVNQGPVTFWLHVAPTL